MDRTRRAGSGLSGKKKILLIVCLIVVALLVGYGILCGAAGRDVIYPHVTVEAVDLGGMTKEEAQAALEKAVQEVPLDETRGVVFTVSTDQGEIQTVEVPLSSVAIDCAATVERAWAVGRDASFLARGGWYLKCLNQGSEILPVYQNSDNLGTILGTIQEELGREPVAPSWEVSGTDLVLVKGTPGNKVDQQVIEDQILAHLGENDIVTLSGAQAQFDIRLEQLPPETLDLANILTQIEKPVQNAQFDKAQKIFKQDSVGVSFDADEAQKTFDAMDWGEKRSLPLTITQPTVTVADLSGQLYQDTLGSCTTNIAGTVNRVENIKLAAKFFNGAVIMPGEEFSYNGLVGSRQASRGFLPAPAYVGGESVQETGGGVCQGSSTVYLAALRANLQITERYPHGYITRYVPEGMDATVYYGAKDFKFKNNTPFPLKVLASVSGRSLTVNIVGTKSDNITVEMTNEVVGTTPYKTVYKTDASVPVGTTQVSVTPYTGYTVKVYRNLYENGIRKETKLESTSVYRSRDKVILVNPADAAQYGL